jgi:hypothetical protein
VVASALYIPVTSRYLIKTRKKTKKTSHMDINEGSRKKRERQDDNIPGAFASPRHMSSCFRHPFAKSALEFADEKDKATACATGITFYMLSRLLSKGGRAREQR